jgi:hypothetical protein
MLTAQRLVELEASEDFQATADTLREYLETLSPNEKGNLLSLVEMYDRHTLDEMVKQAQTVGNEPAETFTRVAAIIRRTQDAVGDLGKLAEKVELLQKEAAALPVEPLPLDAAGVKPPYELPVLSFSTKPEYPVIAAMQKGHPLKVLKTGGWAVIGGRANENQYPTPELVADLLARHVVIPAPGQPWSDPKECYLSAIGWRGMGCLYTDQTAKIEARTYELCGTAEDNATAQYWRSVTAEWRARQARRSTTPGWDKYNEFTLTVSDNITGDGVKTITVIFEPGRGKAQVSAPDFFEFFGEMNAEGYHQHSRSQGTLGKTVTQTAFEIVAPLCAKFAEDNKHAKNADAKRKAAETRAAARPPKPVAPPLTVVDEGEDADELARALGIL